ncbi:hypothetical protein [Endozoicomonas numazuensis]|uniref:Uncharacterized protein n=1 Tax=Endozoicomonas numazuensis TaxID=1137799 RepID=A0A081NHN3_9GAMM|nr:hypothetical protein [Endozoicomonas numazuensis]KEQ17956.1 hypothetical protein GZ78_10080 [Endozoicomonas numazuensis]
MMKFIAGLSKKLWLFIKKHKVFSFFVLTIVAVYWYVDWDGENRFSWKEEVALSTGEVVWVKRAAYFKKGGQIAGPGFIEVKNMTLSIIGDDISDKPKEWSSSFLPVVFDKNPETGQWFVIATWYTTDGPRRVTLLGLPDPKYKYIEFRYELGEWVPYPISMKYIEQRTSPNMLVRVRYSGERNLSLKKKKERWLKRPRGAPKYRCVTDKPYSRGGCEL